MSFFRSNGSVPSTITLLSRHVQPYDGDTLHEKLDFAVIYELTADHRFGIQMAEEKKRNE